MATYARLGNALATARELGYHHQTVYRILSVNRGICSHCSSPIEPDRQYCKECLAKQAERMREKRRARNRAGLCQQCNSPIEYPSLTMCFKHRSKHRTAVRHYDRKVLDDPEKLEHQRIAHLRRKYGQAGVDLWQEREGCCEICNRGRPARQVSIHHLDLDRDHKDNSRENLALLCEDCHKLVHHLAEVASLTRLTEWMHAHYPARC